MLSTHSQLLISAVNKFSQKKVKKIAKYKHRATWKNNVEVLSKYFIGQFGILLFVLLPERRNLQHFYLPDSTFPIQCLPLKSKIKSVFRFPSQINTTNLIPFLLSLHFRWKKKHSPSWWAQLLESRWNWILYIYEYQQISTIYVLYYII